jgi:hypothetical protein
MNHLPTLISYNGTSKCSPSALGITNKREESENYQAVVVRLNWNWRIIECRDAIQWILQRKAGMRHGEPRWDARCYCRTRQGLMRRVRELAGECHSGALTIIGSLPEFMEGGR